MRLLSTPSLSSFHSLIPTTNHSNSSLHFPPHNIRNQFSSRRCSVRCAAGSDNGDSFTAKSGYLFELSATEADSLADYSISEIAAIYFRKPLVVARRLFQTGTAFGKWFGLRYLDARFDRADDMFQVLKLFFLCFLVSRFLDFFSFLSIVAYVKRYKLLFSYDL